MSAKRSAHSSLYLAGTLCFILLAIVLLIYQFMQDNEARIIDQNQQYLEDAASQSVRNMEDVLSNCTMSVSMVSRLYELQLITPRFDYNMLNDMSEPTPFDFIRFVDPDGVSWSGDGATINCRDREYYINGIQGRSGTCFVELSRFTNGPVLLFYTPLYYDGAIIGVVCGVLDADNLTDQLKSSFFGHEAQSCICTSDGAIVAGSWERDRRLGSLQETLFYSGVLSEEDMVQVTQALRSSKSLSFRYNSSTGVGNAYMTPLSHEGFFLVQTLPPDVTRTITARANNDGFRLEISLVVLFLFYIGCLVLYAFYHSRRLARENEDLGQIVDSVKRLYSRFIILDLDKGTYEYLKQGDIQDLGLPVKGAYDDWVQFFQDQHNADPRYWAPTGTIQAQNLRSTLTQEKWYIHEDYPVPGGRWERLSLIKLDMNQETTDRILGAVEDITDTKQRDEASRLALEEAYRAAEAASRSKSDFLSRMSHDIRTPMNAIIGLTAIMGSHLDDRDRVVDCLTKITSSSKHLLGLINEILDMSKIESGKLVLSQEEFSLSNLMDDLLDITRPMVNAKHQTLNVNIRDVKHEDVIGDGLRMQQVCINILSNAVKYTGENGTIDVTLRELPSKQPLLGEYEFIVRDNGIGMSQGFLERIFSPFERADDERISEIQGTGLGMSIAHSIATLMGGQIDVESELGKGSQFTVRLALKLQDTDQGVVEQFIGLPVLVADDEQVACETACIMLDELGMHGEWVLTGREAVDRVAERHARAEDFFAVILDWKMPGMDGLATAKAIRETVGSDVPIVILSAYDWSEIEAEARSAGVNAFMTKPLFKSRLKGVFVNLMSDSSPAAATPLDAVKEKDFTGRRALLVEDNELNQEIAQEILGMTGLTVELAENGKVALEKFQASAPFYYDIVFMDIQMPIMNGYEAARAIRALEREDAGTVPIVAMTANTFNEDVQAALSAGMNQHIGKPLDIDRLMDTLDKWLA